MILADAGYASALDLFDCARTGVELYAPYQENEWTERRRARRPTRRIPKEEFTWRPEEQVYVCPRGHRLPRIGRESRERAEGRAVELTIYRCPKEHCQACPLARRCTSGANGRTVKRNEHEDLIVAHRAKMATPEAKAIYGQRCRTVELRFADAKEHRDCVGSVVGAWSERGSRWGCVCWRTTSWPSGRPASEKRPRGEMETPARTPLKSGTISCPMDGRERRCAALCAVNKQIRHGSTQDEYKGSSCDKDGQDKAQSRRKQWEKSPRLPGPCVIRSAGTDASTSPGRVVVSPAARPRDPACMNRRSVLGSERWSYRSFK